MFDEQKVLSAAVCRDIWANSNYDGQGVKLNGTTHFPCNHPHTGKDTGHQWATHNDVHCKG